MADPARMFAPLAPHEMAVNATKGTKEDDWQPIVPVPDGEPRAFPRHKHGKPSAWWAYLDAEGRLLGLVVRFDLGDGEKEVLPLTFCEGPDGRREWRWKGLVAPRPLYGLDRLAARPDAPVVVCEGEKAADAAERLFQGHVAITSPGGCNAAGKVDWAPLKGRRVVIWPDHDAPGAGYAAAAAKAAKEAGAASVAVVQVPDDFQDGWDLADALPGGWGADKLRRLLDAAQPYFPALDGEGPVDGGATNTPKPGPDVGDYKFRKDGLHFKPEGADGDLHLSGPFTVLAETRDPEGTNWGVLLAWRDHDGRLHQHALARSMLAGDGADARRILMDGGLYVSSQRGAREKLNTYLATVRVEDRARAVTRIGWHDRAFVLPYETIGDSGGERMILQTTAPLDHAFRRRGTLEEWQQAVAVPAVGNSRLVFALSVALAAPLLHLADQESGGFHFRGASSIGKSTMLLAAGSVWGGGGVKGYVKQWRVTDNGLEAVARHHCDALLCLDELSQVDARAAGQVAYMLANGTGKSRALATGDAKASAAWRILFLSSGEISLSDKLAEDGRGRKVTAGQQVRVVDIPADAGAGLGAFEDTHGQDAGAFAQAFKMAAQKFHGTAAPAFIKQCADDPEWVRQAITKYAHDFVEEVCPKNADGQVKRVATRFALVAAAGELAIFWDILPWEAGTAMDGAKVCFQAWMAARGGLEPFEVKAGIAQVRHFMEAHGDSRFTPLGTYGDPACDRATFNRAGFRERDPDGGMAYYVLPEAWKREVCAGADPTIIAKALAERGMLETRPGGKLQVSKRLPGHAKPVSVYKLLPKLLEGDGDA